VTNEKIKQALTYVFLTVAALVSVFPLYWMLSAATNLSVDVSRGVLLPGKALFSNFQNLLQNQDVLGAMINSFKYSVTLTVLSLFVSSLAGYGFEIYHDKAKDTILNIILLAMMIPFAATMIPLFKMFSTAHLLNSTLGFMLPTLATPFLIMMFRQSARSFPHDIIEAARIDGLKEFQIFYRMFVPTMRSTYAAAMVITFMSAWNSYLWPKVIMTDKKSITMPMMVANLKEGYVTDYGMLMLGVLLSTIPTIVIFFALQKRFTEGITGSVK